MPPKKSSRTSLTCTSLIIVIFSASITFYLLLTYYPSRFSLHTSTSNTVSSTSISPPRLSPSTFTKNEIPIGKTKEVVPLIDPPPSLLVPIDNKVVEEKKVEEKKTTTHAFPETSEVSQEDEKKKTTTKKSVFPEVSELVQCPASVNERYRSLDPALIEQMKVERDWCLGAKSRHRVIVGRSWGSLDKGDQKRWEDRHCNEHLSVGTVLPCDEKWGWAWLKQWLANRKSVASVISNVTCFVDKIRTATYCEMKDVMLDFSKVRIAGSSRGYDSGFITIFGGATDRSSLPQFPGLKINPPSVTFSDGLCDLKEEDSVFLLSNDDIFNLGHYINDVMMIWAQLATDYLNPDKIEGNAMMLNMDGFRSGGPAGGPAHRLMLSNAPDSHGPYSPSYYHSWFENRVKKAVDYGRQRVCFSRLITIPLPGVPWFWNDWGRINDCSMIASSPLYQSFNYYLRKSLATRKDSPVVLPIPPRDVLHIVIEVREVNKAKRNNHSTARFIQNLPALIKGLNSIPGVKVTAQNFAALDFVDQIKLAHSAGLMLSMHGAGTTHIFHMAVGEKNCCGLLELFPDSSIEFVHAQGYGNLARMLGLHTMRYVPPLGSTSSAGTMLEVDKVVSIARQLVDKIRTTPTCLHDVKDISKRAVS